MLKFTTALSVIPYQRHFINVKLGKTMFNPNCSNFDQKSKWAGLLNIYLTLYQTVVFCVLAK